MPIRRPRKSKSVVQKSAELAIAVPQVVAHRVTRMALAGPKLSERDRKEFARMVQEKQQAFSQSWSAMALETLRAQQQLTSSMVTAFLNPLSGPRHTPTTVANTVKDAAMGVLNKGLDPVHRKAVSNARRLAKTKLR